MLKVLKVQLKVQQVLKEVQVLLGLKVLKVEVRELKVVVEY